MKNDIYSSHTSSIFNADAGLVALLSYLAGTIIGWIPILDNVSFFAPLIIFFVERNSSFVKFHAMQSFLLNIVASAITLIYTAVLGISSMGAILGFQNIETGIASAGIALIVSILVMVILLVILVYNILAMINAGKYKEFHVPFVGSLSAKLSHIDE